ncbi:MAG: Mov34/MPN/PAD-1 family protein [Lachnospiraceae bacterium]|nr:Mov34/MPN/PAD-1 family protein [Lachnospiraceae bacterium]
MNVVFSDRAYAAVLAETTEKIQTETGGLFLGTFDRGIWYIIEAIDPGPKSIFEVAYFEYDQKYTQHLINKVANLYEQKLTLIGLWHRHPGSFDIFSTTDNGTNSKYAQMRKEGAISALVNIDPKFRITMYHVESPCSYSKISYVVGNDLIPQKYLRLKPLQKYEQIMQNIMQGDSTREDLHPSISLCSFMDKLKPLYSDRITADRVDKPRVFSQDLKDKLIDNTVSDISFMSDEVGIELSVVQKDGLLALIQDTVDGITKVFFAYSEKNDELFFQYQGTNYLYEDGLFENLFGMIPQNENIEMESKPHTQVIVEPETKKIIDGVLRFIGFDRKDE